VSVFGAESGAKKWTHPGRHGTRTRSLTRNLLRVGMTDA
jgi:hypothetical protein